MSDTQHRPIGIARSLRTIAIVAGIVSLIAGVVILIWPVKSAAAITVLVAVYMLVAGLANIVMAARSNGLGGWLRVGLSLLGVLFIVSSVIAFANLASTTAVLAVIVAIMLGVSWIVDGIVALLSLGGQQDAFSLVPRTRGWTIAFAIISIVAGAVVVISPLMSALWLWLLIGVALVVFGITQIIRAATLER
ncbi:MAG: HdeD family acid-resistance protein [Microbacterium sp.]